MSQNGNVVGTVTRTPDQEQSVTFTGLDPNTDYDVSVTVNGAPGADIVSTPSSSSYNTSGVFRLLGILNVLPLDMRCSTSENNVFK